MTKCFNAVSNQIVLGTLPVKEFSSTMSMATMKNNCDENQNWLATSEVRSYKKKYSHSLNSKRVNLFMDPISLGIVPVKAAPPAIFVPQMKQLS